MLTPGRRRLVEEHLDLAGRMATVYSRKLPRWRHELEEDVRSDAYEGLCAAAERYDPTLGPFDRFASVKIHHALREGTRRRMGRYGRPAEIPLDRDHPAPDELGRVDDRDLLDRIRAWANALHPRDRACLYATGRGDKTELARRWGITQGAVSHRRKVVLRRLKLLYQ